VKKFLLVIIVLGAWGYYYQQHHKSADDSSNPEAITNPVYAEVKVGLEVAGRAYDQVLLVQTVDQADCDKVQQKLENRVWSQRGEGGTELENKVVRVQSRPRTALRETVRQPANVCHVPQHGPRQSARARIPRRHLGRNG
jgi:hypothetical protein